MTTEPVKIWGFDVADETETLVECEIRHGEDGRPRMHILNVVHLDKKQEPDASV